MNSNQSIFEKNQATVFAKLQDKIIIHSKEYISNEDIQIDGDGPQSTWNQTFLCIEKTNDDYIFHFFNSEYFDSYSYPHFNIINKYHHGFKKFSELKNDFSDIFDKSHIHMNHFLNSWYNSYSYGFNTSDKDLNDQMMILHNKCDELEIICEEKFKIDREKRDKEYEEYLKSDEYKQYLAEDFVRNEIKEEEYREKEAERLKRCIAAYGEKDGYRFWKCL